MKTKKIRIRSRDSFYGEISQHLDLTLNSTKKRGKVLTGSFFESLEAVSSVLTPKRLAVWKAIRDKKPSSILALALSPWS
jgi:predicted transcriptional regulator